MGKAVRSSQKAKSLVKKNISKAAVVITPTLKSPQCEAAVVETKLTALSKTIGEEPASRGKRKRAVKRARIVSKAEFIRRAMQNRANYSNVDSHGSALGSFAELEEAVLEHSELQEVESSATPQAVLKRVKKPKSASLGGELPRSKKLASDQLDVERYNALMSAPAFSADPIAAMEKHLAAIKRRRDEKQNALVSSKMEVS